MSEKEQLKVQAFFDGELPAKERRKVAAWIEGDAGARRLLAGLQGVRETMAAGEPMAMVPESREFYWSRIRREIEQGDDEAKTLPGFDWRRWLWPVSATAVCFLVIVLSRPISAPETVASVSIDRDTPVVETVQPDTAAATYRDESAGTTLVWFSTDEKPGQKVPAAF
ncbi:MAG TPA: hypothetical protein VN625_07375 [Desulfuromonadaceae bacterium]|nr:hypothetical protein [Desulfuromonadaceae bacterium]